MPDAIKKARTNFNTGVVIISYPNVDKPRAANVNSAPKYSVSLIISKNDKITIGRANDAIADLKEEAKGKYGGKLPNSFKLPLHDGDKEKEDDAAYKNSYYLNASSTQPPGVVGPDREPLMNKQDLYAGCYAKVNLNFYLYDNNGNKGIGVGLNHIMKIKDGKALDGRITVDQAFKDEPDEDDNQADDDFLK